MKISKLRLIEIIKEEVAAQLTSYPEQASKMREEALEIVEELDELGAFNTPTEKQVYIDYLQNPDISGVLLQSILADLNKVKANLSSVVAGEVDATVTPVSKKRSRSNPIVKKIQKVLVDAGYPVGRAGIDGVPGKDTVAAYNKFMRATNPNHKDVTVKSFKEVVRGDIGREILAAMIGDTMKAADVAAKSMRKKQAKIMDPVIKGLTGKSDLEKKMAIASGEDTPFEVEAPKKAPKKAASPEDPLAADAETKALIKRIKSAGGPMRVQSISSRDLYGKN